MIITFFCVDKLKQNLEYLELLPCYRPPMKLREGNVFIRICLSFCSWRTKRFHDSLKKKLWGHWYPCFGLLMMSPLGFKVRMGSLIHTRWRYMWNMFPEIHLCCDTCWPLGSQDGCQAGRDWNYVLSHGVWRARHSDWSPNSFIMVVNEKFKLSQNFLSKGRLEKNSLIDNHYKSVRMACSSYTVYHSTDWAISARLVHVATTFYLF